MLTNISKKIEIAANIAIVVVAFLLTTVLVKNYLINRHLESADVSSIDPLASPDLNSLNIDWRVKRETLVLAVSTTCHFCTESAGFYKQLAQHRGSIRIVAVLPQPVDEGKRYLDGLGITVDDIKQASLSTINVTGTPTLILVNEDGKVSKTWIGKLDSQKEIEVLEKMQIVASLHVP